MEPDADFHARPANEGPEAVYNLGCKRARNQSIEHDCTPQEDEEEEFDEEEGEAEGEGDEWATALDGSVDSPRTTHILESFPGLAWLCNSGATRGGCTLGRGPGG